MGDRIRPVGVLAIASAILVIGACAPPPTVPAPSPAASETVAARPSAAVPSTTPSPTVAPTTPSPTPSPTLAASPPVGCPAVSGGRALGQRALGAVRIAHQPGFDRVVFDFGSLGNGEEHGVPIYSVQQAVSFTAPSGQSVAVEGNARLGVRFLNVGPMGTYGGPADIRPATPLVREVRLVEDFEGTLSWGIGLHQLQCPRIQELSEPDRLVIDLPTPP